MNASLTSTRVALGARMPMRSVAAALLLFFGAAAMAGGRGHGGGHGIGHQGGAHFSGHRAHHAHGFIGFGTWYPCPSCRVSCRRYAPDYDPVCFSDYYRYDDDRAVPSADDPGSSSAPQWIYGATGVVTGLDDEAPAQSMAAGNPGRLSVRAGLLPSPEAPESLPEITRIGNDQTAPDSARGSWLRQCRR